MKYLKFAGEIQELARFTKGHSGNPAGKPKGVKDKRMALRELLAPHAESLVRKAVELARAGDTTALRLCLERIIAPVRAKDEPVDLRLPGENMTDNGQHILEAGITGKITPTEAAALEQKVEQRG